MIPVFQASQVSPAVATAMGAVWAEMARKEGHAPRPAPRIIPKEDCHNPLEKCLNNCGRGTRSKARVCNMCLHTAPCQCPRCIEIKERRAKVNAVLFDLLAGGVRLTTRQVVEGLEARGIEMKPHIIARCKDERIRSAAVGGNARRTRVWWLDV